MSQNEDELSDELAKVRISFTDTAEAYRKSTAHGNPADLARMIDEVNPREGEDALDVGCGGGHTAVAIAAAGCRTVALDVTPAMLRETKLLAADRHVGLRARFLADGQMLPFAKRSFDIVTCRLAVHHFGAPPVAVREMARVLRPGGRLYIFDLSAPDEPELGRFLNEIERLRDSSHVASLASSQWRRMIETVGLEAKSFRWAHRAPYDMQSWLDRSQTPPASRKEINRRLATAPDPTKKLFQIEENKDGSFRFGSPVIEILALKH